jgi:hypothetical protein
VIDYENTHLYDECMLQLYDQADWRLWPRFHSHSDPVHNLQISDKENYGYSLKLSLNPVSENPSCDHLSFTKTGLRYTGINNILICYSPTQLKFTDGILNILADVHGIGPMRIIRIVECQALLISSKYLEKCAYSQMTVPNVRKLDISRWSGHRQMPQTHYNWSEGSAGSHFKIFFEFQVYGSVLKGFLARQSIAQASFFPKQRCLRYLWR